MSLLAYYMMAKGKWLTSDAVKALDDPPPGFREALGWIEEFVGEPHPDLGRSGPVCPFIPQALRSATLYFRSEPEAVTVEAVDAVVEEALADFGELPPTDADALYKSLIMIFPAVAIESAADVIDRVQRIRKPEFVDRGLMIGQFHERNSTPAAHNPSFLPLQSPVPMIAVRMMVPEDVPFLTADEYTAEERLRFLGSYLRHLQSWPLTQRRDRQVQAVIAALIDQIQRLAT